MKLVELLKVIAHEDYTITLQDINYMNEEREIYNPKNEKTVIKPYLDYTVVSLDENWNIVIKGQKIA